MTTRTPRTLRFSHVAVALAALALFVAGCGSDSDSGSKSDSKAKSSSSKDTTTATTDSTDAASDGDSSGSGSGAAGGSGLAKAASDVTQRADQYSSAPTLKLDPKQKYVVELDTDKGTILIDVDQKAGPIAAANFVALVDAGFYNGVKFHRIIKDFMVQTGDPTGTGTGGPGYEIKDDNVDGDYAKGTVAMANAGPDTGGSQFFIVQGDSVQLPPNYAIFGHVEPKSLKAVDALGSVSTEDNGQGEQSRPTGTIKVKSAKLVSGTLPS